jgi:hypothetical protein
MLQPATSSAMIDVITKFFMTFNFNLKNRLFNLNKAKAIPF